jgi:hypothetical protein
MSDEQLKKATAKMEAEIRLFEDDKYKIKAYGIYTFKVCFIRTLASLTALSAFIAAIAQIMLLFV